MSHDCSTTVATLKLISTYQRMACHTGIIRHSKRRNPCLGSFCPRCSQQVFSIEQGCYVTYDFEEQITKGNFDVKVIPN